MTCHPRYRGQSIDISDAERDGLKLRFSLEIEWYFGNYGYYGYHDNYDNSNDESYSLTIYTMSCDEHYYRYHQSYEPHHEARWDPFAEPSPLYTNFDNGLGVFGSYLNKSATKLIDPDDLMNGRRGW